MRKFDMQLFAAPTNTIVKADLEPAISIDCVSRLGANLDELKKILGICEMEPMPSGASIKIYKMVQVNTPDQVGEGETIALTEIKRTLARTVDITLKKYRKTTTAEAVQKVGRKIAINDTDAKLISGVQKGIKKSFFDTLLTGTGTASGTSLQTVLADAWGKVIAYHEDEDASPLFIVSSADVAEYLGSAQITMQQAFGFTYIENFLGLGTAIVSPALTKGKIIATAKENLHGAYVPANSGDVASLFDLTSDETGLVGMVHTADPENATVGTLVLSGVVFYPEYLDGVFVGTISAATTPTNPSGNDSEQQGGGTGA